MGIPAYSNSCIYKCRCRNYGNIFNKAEIPGYLNGLDRVENFRQALLDSGISPEITQKILFENARRFFEKNL